MRHVLQRLPATLIFLLLAKGLYAQQAPATTVTPVVPRLVRITSTVHSTNGVAAAPVESVTLSIHKDEQGGAPLWQETQNIVVDAEGRFTVLLGSTLPEGIPLELFTAAEPRWLAVQFNRSAETEPRRVLFASVPYALKASDAETLGGRPASSYALARTVESEPSIGTSGDPAPSPAAVLGGTANAVAKYVNTVDVGPSVMSEVGGLVGINTQAPVDVLHARFTNTNGSMTGLAVQNLGSTATSYSGMLFYDQNGALGQFQGFNNGTHEYRINNIALSGTINFMIGGSSKFQVLNNGDSRFAGAATVHIPNATSLGFGNNSLTGNVGSNNTAVGLNTITGGNTGAFNAAFGANALQVLTTGVANTGLGFRALNAVLTGSGNTGLGSGAGVNVTSGGSNIFLGESAGFDVTTNSFNIEIGNDGAASDSGVIRIGRPTVQTTFFAAGVRGVTTVNNNAVPVVIDSAGQLGTVSSSRRFKEDIQDMGDASRGLMRLRPVTFRYKQPFGDGSKPVQYGLIAEEVEEVYPDLVAHSADGQIETVKYQVLDSMLLNELQRQQAEIEAQKDHIRALEERLATLEQALAARLSTSAPHPSAPTAGRPPR